MGRKTTAGVGALVLALLGTMFVLFLPVWQSITYSLFVQHPSTWWWVLIGGLAAGGVYHVADSDVGEGVMLVLLALTVIMALFIGPIFAGIYAQEDIAHSGEIQESDVLPDTSNDHPRILPRAVADEFGSSSMQLPQYELSDSDVAYHDGSYTWSYALQPGPFMVAWQGNQTGAMFVDMETQDKEIEVIRRGVQCGVGQVFIDSYDYQMTLDRLDVDRYQGTQFTFEHDGELHVAQSYATHEWRFRLLPLPQPYTVPEYGGTQVISEDCEVRDLSPSEVAESDLFEGQNTYPYDLSMFRVEAQQLQHGIINKIFYQKDVPQFDGVAGHGNDQPFVVPTENGDGLKYFVAAEPAGSGNGIYQIYTLDAQTGEIEYVEYSDTQIGPQKAVDFVRKESPNINWAAGGGGTMEAIEPIPVVDGDQLYWQVRVVPTDNAGMSYTAFVNASSGSVTETKNDQEIMTFLRKGSSEVPQEPSDPSEDEETALVVAIVENGTVVDTINVTEEQAVEIRSGNSTDS